MANQFENSLSRLAHGETLAPLGVVLSVVLLFLIVGAALSVNLGSRLLLLIFVLLIIGVFAFAYQYFSQFRKLAAARGESRISWDAALPEVQRQNLNLEVLELSRILETGTEQLSDLQSAYIVAEDLALRQIQQEEKIPLLRHVSVCGAPFNAVMVKDDILVCGEVSFLISPDLRQDRIDSMLRKIDQVKKGLELAKIEMRPKLMMILITQLNPEDETRLRAGLGKRRFSSTPVDIDIRLLDFEALQRIYVTD
ncbi:MAG TPA: hypothetical protein VK468_04745 [Pyrinomonadaceae bacterium]|nr:hypothetical protein [Pyrinomonadaceae bacterium]